MLCAAQLKLAALGFTQVGMTDAQASFFSEHFAVQLAQVDEAVRVTTPKDIADALGIERQKQLLGCSDESSSCMAELAGALGADGLVAGQLAKVGKSYQLNIKILAANGTRTLFIYSSKLLATEEDVIGELNEVAARAIAKVRAQLTVPAAAVAAPVEPEVAAAGEAPPRSKLRLLVSAGGLALVGLGSVPLGLSADKYGKLTDTAQWPTLDPNRASSLRNDGKTELTAGLTLAIIGVIALAAGLVWYLKG